MDIRPIGMLDSGIGGITVLKEIKKVLPKEDILYYGDTLNFPYGNKSKDTIIKLTKLGIDFLIKKGVKAIVIACGTATSQALEEIKGNYKIPIIGIIKPTIELISEKKFKKIGVIATEGTIRSNSWENNIKNIDNNILVYNKACPMLAPMAEEGWTNNQIAKLAVSEYLKELKEKNIDSIILGCTHYPLFKECIQKELGNSVYLINTGEMTSNKLKEILQKENMLKEKGKSKVTVYLTNMECNFKKMTNKYLNEANLNLEIKKV